MTMVAPIPADATAAPAVLDLTDPRVDEMWDTLNESAMAGRWRETQVAPMLEKLATRRGEYATMARQRADVRGQAAVEHEARMAAHAAETDVVRAKLLDAVSAGAESFTTPHILSGPLVFPPKSDLDAHRVNGVLADVAFYSVSVLARVIRDALASTDRPLLARLFDVVASKHESDPRYQTAEIRDLLVQTHLLLRDARVVNSDAARRWAADAKRDVVNAVQLLEGERPGALQTYASTGALPTLFPRAR